MVASTIAAVIVDDLSARTSNGVCELSARVRGGDGSEPPRLYYRFPESFAPARMDASPFLAALLVFALRAGEDIEIAGPVSPRLLERLDGILDVWESFFPGEVQRRISVHAEVEAPPSATTLTGSFFSRGIDSWFAVLTALEDDPQTPPLTHLVFCPDFMRADIWPQELVEAKTESTRRAAALTGCEFVIVETNQKRVFGGLQLLAMGLALGFERMLIPSSGMLGELIPRATHPDLDPRFSTERTQLVHYGTASRRQKVARVARSPAALRTVHVCRFNRAESEDNCGRCEKCLRTMIHLHLAGALDHVGEMFREPLDPRAVAGMSKEIKHPHQWEEILHALGASAGDRELAAAVRLVIVRAHLRNAYEQMREVGFDPGLVAVRDDFPDAIRSAFEVVRRLHRGLAPDAPPQRSRRQRRLVRTALKAVEVAPRSSDA